MVRIQKNLAPWTSKSYVCTFFLQQMHNDYDDDCYYCYCQGHIWKGSIFHVSISASGFTPPWFCPFSPPFTRPVTTTEPLGSWAEMVHSPGHPSRTPICLMLLLTPHWPLSESPWALQCSSQIWCGRRNPFHISLQLWFCSPGHPGTLGFQGTQQIPHILWSP